LRFLLPALALAAALGGAALASTGGVDQLNVPVIKACVKERSGLVRILLDGGSCRKHERTVTWGSGGGRGATGPTGPSGPAGPAGSALGSIDSLDGVACTRDGTAGTIDLTYDSAGHVVLTCTPGSGGGGGGGSVTGLRINEFMTGVTGAASDEFVELMNT